MSGASGLGGGQANQQGNFEKKVLNFMEAH